VFLSSADRRRTHYQYRGGGCGNRRSWCNCNSTLPTRSRLDFARSRGWRCRIPDPSTPARELSAAVRATAMSSKSIAGATLTEFVEAVRLIYNLASGMELVVDEGAPHDLQRQGRSESEALDLICEWLHAQEDGR
jgi:hypothetical protein